MQAKLFSNKKGLSGIGSVIFNQQNYNELTTEYGNVFGAFTTDMIKAHKYFALETDNFTNWDNINDSDDLHAEWHAHLQKVNKISQKIDQATRTGYTPNYTEGERYKQTQNLSTKEIAALIREEIAILYPKDEYTISVTYETFSGGSSINVRVKKMPFNPFAPEYRNALNNNQNTNDYRYQYYNEHNTNAPIYNDEAKAFISKLERIVKQYNFNDSDSMTDYFDVNFYAHVDIEDYAILQRYYPNHPEIIESQKRNAAWEEKRKRISEIAAKNREEAGNFKKGQLVFYSREKLHPSWHKHQIATDKYLAVVAKSVNGRSRSMFTSIEVFILKKLEPTADNIKKVNDHLAWAKTKKGYTELNYFVIDGIYYQSTRPALATKKDNLEPFTSLTDTEKLTQDANIEKGKDKVKSLKLILAKAKAKAIKIKLQLLDMSDGLSGYRDNYYNEFTDAFGDEITDYEDFKEFLQNVEKPLYSVYSAPDNTEPDHHYLGFDKDEAQSEFDSAKKYRVLDWNGEYGVYFTALDVVYNKAKLDELNVLTQKQFLDKYKDDSLLTTDLLDFIAYGTDVNTFEDVDYHTVPEINKSTDDLINEVQFELPKLLAETFDYDGRTLRIASDSHRYFSKYNNVDVYATDDDGDEVRIGSIKLRIADHSYNPRNNSSSTYEDGFISVVVANKDATKDRFHGKYNMYFDEDNTISDIDSEVSMRIREIIEWEWDIEQRIKDNDGVLKSA